MGQVKLDERATGKRAWTSWNRARELHGTHTDECTDSPSNRRPRKVGSERKRSAGVSADANAGRG